MEQRETVSNLANLFNKNNYNVEIICIYKKKEKVPNLSKGIKLNYLNCKTIKESIFKLRSKLNIKKVQSLFHF